MIKRSAYYILLILLPKNMISRIFGFIANKSWSRMFIESFIKKYHVNCNEMKNNLSSFKTFNEFFIRELKDTSRIIDEKDNPYNIISPVDGMISQYGITNKQRLIQAKGRFYYLSELLQDESKVKIFQNSYYMTIYLSPSDYHRIHSPVTAKVESMSYIPGNLFPVNNFSVKNISNLFCINERLTSFFDFEGNKLALIKVGATVVGKIKIVYDYIESNSKYNILHKDYKRTINFNKGEQLAHFELGSTVIMLFQPKNKFEFNSNYIEQLINNNQKIKLGTSIANWIK